MKQQLAIPKLSKRPADGHKGTFGKVLIVGGSRGFSGAPALAAKAALRSGAGLVRAAVPRSIQPIVAALDPCYTTLALPEDESGQCDEQAACELVRWVRDNDVAAFGPGAGTGRGVRQCVSVLLGVEDLPLVIDADGLNVLAAMRGADRWIQTKKARPILTPHPGEMRRLWHGVCREPMPADRVEQAVRLAGQTGCIVVLKGAGTVVTDGSRYYVNTTGNPGMATGGAGDVLTGVIAALCGQGMNRFEAAVLGVYAHGLAGDLAADKLGQISLTATDLIDWLKDAFLSCFNA